VSIEEHAASLVAQAVPAEVIDLLTYLFSEVLDGHNAFVCLTWALVLHGRAEANDREVTMDSQDGWG
jgi:hypothetical protein